MSSLIDLCKNGAEVVKVLDATAKKLKLKRKLRVYVMNYKKRSHAEMERLIKSADIVVDLPAWKLLDDPARYEWVNK